MSSWIKCFGSKINLDHAIRIAISRPLEGGIQKLTIIFTNPTENLYLKFDKNDPTDVNQYEEVFKQVETYLASKE